MYWAFLLPKIPETKMGDIVLQVLAYPKKMGGGGARLINSKECQIWTKKHAMISIFVFAYHLKILKHSFGLIGALRFFLFMEC